MKTKLSGFLIAQTSNKQYSSNYSHIAKNARSSCLAEAHIPCTRGLWALFLERSDVYELHHLSTLLGPPQWGIKREKKELQIDRPAVTHTGCAWLDTERVTRAALSTYTVRWSKVKRTLHAMQQKNKVETFEGRARAHRAPPPVGSAHVRRGPYLYMYKTNTVECCCEEVQSYDGYSCSSQFSFCFSFCIYKARCVRIEDTHTNLPAPAPARWIWFDCITSLEN